MMKNNFFKLLADFFGKNKEKEIIIPKSKQHLKRIIKKEIKRSGLNCDLNHIDVSNIVDMSFLFSKSTFDDDISEFNGNISQWDVSRVGNMRYMFKYSEFNGDISQWDVSNVENMDSIFFGSKSNGDISNWNVSNVKNMHRMFEMSEFNGDISKWNVSKVTSMEYMFIESKCTSNISDWKPCELIYQEDMFLDSKIIQPYWAKVEDKDERQRMIDKYSLAETLNSKLDEKLNNDNRLDKKVKI